MRMILTNNGVGHYSVSFEGRQSHLRLYFDHNLKRFASTLLEGEKGGPQILMFRSRCNVYIIP